jgi:hypothetical protein
MGISYSDIPNDMRSVIDKLLKSVIIVDTIDLLAPENLSFEARCNTFCKSFDIVRGNDSNSVSHIRLIFDIVKPLLEENNERIIHNVAAEIIEDSNNLKLIYAKNTFGKFPVKGAYIERYFYPWLSTDTYHVLNQIINSSTIQVKRVLSEIIPHNDNNSTIYLDNSKDMITFEEICIAQMLHNLGQQRFWQMQEQNDSERSLQYVLVKSFK